MAGLWPGTLVLLTLSGIVGGAFIALLTRAPELEVVGLWHDVYLRRVAFFTVWQALLSTLLSVGLAVPVARALARRQRFLGREWLIKVLGLPLVIPTIVAVFGIVAVYGPIRMGQRYRRRARPTSMGAPVRAVRHPAGARVLQSTARCPSCASAVGHNTRRNLALGEPARHESGSYLALNRVAATATGAARGGWIDLHALLHQLRGRAHAGGWSCRHHH